MAVTTSDWHFLDDVVRSLNAKIRDGAEHIPLPTDRTGPEAREYLAKVQARFDAIEKHIDAAIEHPIAYDVGRAIGAQLVVGAKRGAKIAHEIAKDLAENFEKTADRLEEGGKEIARGFGGVAALVLIGLAIWALRKA